MDPIDVANKKTLEVFIKDYLPGTNEWNTWQHPTTQVSYNITLLPAKALTKADFMICFNLIEETSATDYKQSRTGWKPSSKKKEMALLDLKYVLVKDENEQVKGFMSFMPTYEDDEPVIYCYEIHLSPVLQGTGLGTQLIQLLEKIGAEIPATEKVMLTVFTRNIRGVRFYEKLGFEKDEYSPLPKVLRNGTKVEAEYVILSKPISR